VGTVHVSPVDAAPLFTAAAAVAAGFDPLATDAPGTVLWREGDRELLVDTAKVVGRFGPGVIAVSIPVSCDQSRPAFVHVSFVVAPDRPAARPAPERHRSPAWQPHAAARDPTPADYGPT
jgi:hypothetical protein